MIVGVEQDVRGLDVTMDETARVRGVERIADLRDEAAPHAQARGAADAHEVLAGGARGT